MAREDPRVKTLCGDVGSDERGRMDERRSGEHTPDDDSPTGGDETTEEQLEADNPAEEDTLDTLDPDSPPA